MKIGYLRQDDSGHWYVVPENIVERFDKLMRDICEIEEHTEKWYEAVDWFISRYDRYRLGGGYQDVKCVME
jgi:hypothetical protein